MLSKKKLNLNKMVEFRQTKNGRKNLKNNVLPFPNHFQMFRREICSFVDSNFSHTAETYCKERLKAVTRGSLPHKSRNKCVTYIIQAFLGKVNYVLSIGFGLFKGFKGKVLELKLPLCSF